MMMEGQPKVSVIIPVYNAEKHLRECLDSVCSQTLPEIEIICVNDCSQDQSNQILCEYANKFATVKIIQQPENLGAGPARNAGIEAATGEYIAFMDADDSYPDINVLRNVYNTALQNEALICGGGVLFQFEDKIVPGKNGNDTFIFEHDGWIEYQDYQQFFYYQRFIFSRDMLVEYGIVFPEYLRFQDPPFFVKAMVSAKRFYAMKDYVYVYRNDGAHVNWNKQKINDLLKGSLDVLQLCIDYRLDKLYSTMLKRYLDNRFVLNVIEDSLISGNDEVLEFYRKIVDTLDLDLLGEQAKKLDLLYAQKIAKAKLRRNIHYQSKTIEYQDFSKEESYPKVSVIIPVYNTKEYLGTCMDSILGQTLEDIEIICIDDGSDDGSSDILKKYERRYGNVSVYRQENAGLSAARNAGLPHVRGKYLYFMDSDDVLARTALEELWEYAEKDDLDIVYFSAKSFYESSDDEKAIGDKYFDSAYKRKAEYPAVMSGPEMLVSQTRNQDYYTPVWIQFYKAEFIRKNQLAFYEGLLHEDNLFSLTAIAAAERVRCINSTFFYRRVRSNSIMTAAVDYRNLLGYFLSAVEGARMLANIQCQTDVKDVIRSKLYALSQNHVSYKWLKLHPADRVLFRASLTPEDRMFFETFSMPMITLREQIQKSPKDVREANQQTQKLKDEINKLKKEINNLKKIR